MRELLPEIMAKLIQFDCGSDLTMEFPSGDSISKTGWDGVCETTVSSLFVPKGKSYWEIGTNKGIKPKADKDYFKRTNDTPKVIKEKSTFIFVTSRRWSGKSKWRSNKDDLSDWKEVRVIDADDLELWLENSPSVGSWVARRFSIFPDEVEAAEDYWKDWSYFSEFEITPELVISNRIKEADQISNFVGGDFGGFEVQGTSIEEVIAFIISSLITGDKKRDERSFPKTIIVQKFNTLQSLNTSHKGLIIICTDDDCRSLSKYENHVFFCLDFQSNSSGLTLPITKRDAFAEKLKELGFEYDKAYMLSNETGRSLSILRRFCLNTPGKVNWFKDQELSELIPLFFTGKLDDEKDGDRDIIRSLWSNDYQSYKRKLKKWVLLPDPPLYQVLNMWKVVSPYDLLFVVAKHITEEDLEKFEQCFLGVFSEIDPALELEPDQRMAAVLFKKNRKFSSWVRNGMCQSLVLLSVFGDEAGIKVSFNIQVWADRIVRQLLKETSLEHWLSNANIFHYLVEASPNAFIDSLEKLVKDSPEVLAGMFRDNGDGLFSPVYHTDLLSAIEALAWDVGHLSRATLLLANLVELDTGKVYANRPKNSLKNIYLFWLPHTYGSLDYRIESFKALMNKKPNVAFDILIEMSPKSIGDTAMPSNKYKWRLRQFVTETPYNSEILKNLEFMANALIELSGNISERWVRTIEVSYNYPSNLFKSFVDALVLQDTFHGEIHLLREKLRSFVTRHREYSEQDWSADEKQVGRLEEFHSTLISNLTHQYYWLFDRDPIWYGRREGLSYQDMHKTFQDKRLDATKEIISEMGFDGLKELAEISKTPWLVGYNYSQLPNDEKLVFELISSTEKHIKQLCEGYFNGSAQLKGLIWIKEKLIQLSNDDESSLLFLLSLFLKKDIMNLLNELPLSLSDTFWKTVPISCFHRLDGDDLAYGIDRLCDYKRFSTSLHLLLYLKEDTASDLIYRTLEGLPTNPLEEGVSIQGEGWQIAKYIKALDHANFDKEKIAQLEWYYVDILNDRANERRPLYLHDSLAQNPSFFADLVSFIYWPQSQIGKDELSQQGLNKEFLADRGRKADKLIENWPKLPGTQENGDINLEILTEWVKKAIDACTKKDRLKWGKYQVGKKLGQTVSDRDQNWPNPSICQILEDYDDFDLNQGFYIGVSNGRRSGVLRSGGFGGTRERSRADYFDRLSEKLVHNYPVISSVLRELANSNRHSADYMDKLDQQDEL
ncbi:hypothetical protein [uncultured Roseivirga sp.]|uniref:hypothetical protein n=1 Tax=uncultured Roseivirga sp. TaxID=543088 RepID=UPI00258C0A8D|nr:hypothetical protein [uncultured Roseivirga sp.]